MTPLSRVGGQVLMGGVLVGQVLNPALQHRVKDYVCFFLSNVHNIREMNKNRNDLWNTKGNKITRKKRRNFLLLLFLNHFWSGGPSSLMMNEVDLADTHTNTHTLLFQNVFQWPTSSSNYKVQFSAQNETSTIVFNKNVPINKREID